MVLVVAALCWGHRAAAADLVIRVVGVRSDRGVIHYAVYDSPAAFPNYEGRVAKGTAPIRGNSATVRIGGLPAGSYAVAVYHDENGNDRFDQGFLGIPLEDYGFSKNASGFFSAPSFDSAAFPLREPVTEIVIDLRQ